MAAPLTPWVSIYDVLGRYAPELIDPDTGEIIGDPIVVAQWQSAIDYATWTLSTLSRGAVHPEECWIDEYLTTASCKIQLRHQPLLTVIRVDAVTVCGSSINAPSEIEYCLIDPRTIDVCCSTGGVTSSQCGCFQTAIRVYYRTDSTLPPSTEYLIAWLANQLMLQQSGRACELPQRVTSVSRQGVSWSFVDPMDFLDKGLTGIGQVDTWVSLVRLNYPSSRLIDPLRSQLRTTRRVNCDGAEFQSVEYSPSFNVTTDMVG